MITELEKIYDPFEVISDYIPSGDQPQAIADITKRIQKGEKDVVLMGATGTGKTATTAWMVEKLQRPTLIIEPNKTLAAQLAAEFRELMPNNRIEYFVSYYDYYRPESYLPQTDTYIEKDSSINDEIERLRHSATASLLTHRDVVVVASVSCIYGLGSPQEYQNLMVGLQTGQTIARETLIKDLVAIQYTRNDYDFQRGTFRVKGDTLEVFPMYETKPVRIEFFGDEIERLSILDPISAKLEKNVEKIYIFPASHYVTDSQSMTKAITGIRQELNERIKFFEERNKLVELQRLQMRTTYDLTMLEEIGTCKGVENYSMHMDGRAPGTPPWTLIDFFPPDFLLVIDESHITIPQIGAMYEGDMARKRSLVDFGFRLPSCMDNRPLNFSEFQSRIGQTVYLSATPGPYELKRSRGVVEQIIRPTGLVDPQIEVRPTENQIDDLMEQIQLKIEKNQRVLVTTLTKRMAEDLTKYLDQNFIKVSYLHSDVDTLKRVELLRSLRLGEFDVLVGINLLREGLDLPEVGLVAILDADKQGFLRSYRSLIQTIGRAARNIDGRVIMYADSITEQMQAAIEETNRRRVRQLEYNKNHGVDPQPLYKKIADVLDMIEKVQTDNDQNYNRFSREASRNALNTATAEVAELAAQRAGHEPQIKTKHQTKQDIEYEIKYLTEQMRAFASELQFELAARLRDEIADLKKEYRELS
ncbi:MAG: excinuclease ABC subunit UvrB [Bifidobacteriaceae bacterium]|nr:excinuclease ABC subunit UvrB [Bifidobacteriaceae bacterium]